MVEYLSGNRIQGSSTANKTPDYTSDFTSVSSDGDGVGWTSSDTSKFYVDASEDKYFFNTNASFKSSYFDLDNATNAPNVGTLTTSYVIRWKMKFNAVTSSANYWEIGLSDGTGERNADQHFNGLHMRENHFRISVTKDNQSPDEASGTYLSAVSPTETFNTTDTIYFELIRDGVDFTLNRYTADDYSTGKTTPCTLTINNSTWVGAPAAIMRYFRIITNNSATQTGHVWDVKFYNDVTSALSDEKTTLADATAGTRYEETDTRKIYTRKYATGAFTHSWVERGTEGSMTATLWSCADTSAMYAGGTTSAWTANNTTQTWNGSSWSGASNLSASRELLDGGGNATDYISVGGDSGGAGSPQDDVYKWDGSSWSSGGTTSSNTFMLSAGGDTTDALWCGGNNGSGALSTAQTYDGSSWTAISSMSDARRGHAGDGTSSDFLAVGGYDDGSSTQRTAIEAWNGTSWSAGTAYNGSNGDMYGYGGGAGRTSSFIAQSNQRSQSNTYTYNGSAWALTNNSTGGSVNYSGVGGDSGNAIKAGGSSSSSWAANTSEKFNGTNWTATNNLNTGISTGGMGGNN